MKLRFFDKDSQDVAFLEGRTRKYYLDGVVEEVVNRCLCGNLLKSLRNKDPELSLQAIERSRKLANEGIHKHV
jgi:hypothetical protein